jgi:long-chain acyl-CoA synthetase
MVGGIERTITGSPLPARLYAGLARRLGRLGRRIGLPLGRFLCAPIRRKIGPKLRLIISAGAALPAEVNEFLLNLGFAVIEGYGLTETSPAVAITPLRAPRPGSVGLPLPGAEIRFGPAREDGSAEVMVRGPMVMRGYHKRPDLTAEVMEDGFFRTGDLGRLDADGYLWITGRAKEVIVLPSGKNVYPEEVEKHYLRSAAIKEICALQDPANQECLHAVVVPEENVALGMHEGLRSMVQFQLEECSRELPSYQRIGGFTLTAEPLPRTRLGKLKRGTIAAMLPSLMEGSREDRPLSPDEEELLSSEAGACVIEVLSELAGRPVRPSEHLEIDVGLDSLRRLEALTRIESALGIEVDPEAASQVARPVDLVALLKAGRARGAAAFSWHDVLRTEPVPPLAAIVTVDPGWPTRAFRRFARGLLRSYLGFRFGLDVAGAEHLPAEGACIVSPNHVSLVDAVVMFCALPRRQFRRMCFFAVRSQFESLFRRLLVKPARIILTDQLGGTRQSLQYGAAALRRGLSLCIFPEGRRSATGGLEPGRPGTGLLARERGVPVVPAVIRGTEAVWSRLPEPPPPGRLSVTFGPPIPPEAFMEIENEADLGRPWDAAMQALVAGGPL